MKPSLLDRKTRFGSLDEPRDWPKPIPTGVSRRDLLKIGGAAGLGALVVSQTACPKATVTQLEKWGLLVADELHAVAPTLKNLGLPHFELVAKAEKVARDFVAAVKASDNVSALEFLGQLTGPDGMIAQIAEDAGLIKDANIRKYVEGALVIAHITLALIAANIQSNVPANAMTAARAAGKGRQAASVASAANSNVIEGTFKLAFAQ